MEWLRQRITMSNDEKGDEQWQQIVSWVDTPPAAVTARSAAPQRVGGPSPRRRAVEAQVGPRGAAFAAFASHATTGG